MTIEKTTRHCGKLFNILQLSNRCNITPPCAERREVTFRVMKLGPYIIVDDSGNYVTFHELDVRIKTGPKLATEMFFFFQSPDGKMRSPKSVYKIFP